MMRLLESAILFFAGTGLYQFVRKDWREYARFKLLSSTADRQKRYRVWIFESFLFFAGATVAGVGMLGRWRSLVRFPAEFEPLSERLRSHLPALQISGGFIAGFCIAVAAALVIKVVLAMRYASAETSMMVGDIAPLMPRNWPETAHTAVLSLNAGLSEELFFRLFLPLTIALLSGNAIVAFAVTAVVFGTMHVYQGAVGVVVTTFLGLGFAGVYLATRSIWITVALHASFDLLVLVVRPTLVRLIEAARGRS